MVGLVVGPTTLDKGARFDPCSPIHPIRAEGESSPSSVHRLADRPCWDVAVIGTATVRQELPVSPIVPSLPQHLVQLGFDYVLAVKAGDDARAP